jgi:ABC-type bacteriocin/lantibiotic exporter with double-glycine peptidase domain
MVWDHEAAGSNPVSPTNLKLLYIIGYMRMLEFPEFKQMCGYDCGANALLSVLTYYGINTFEEEIIKSAKTSENGTPINGMLKVLKNNGLKADLKQLDVDEIKKYIDKKIPIILRIQAWSGINEDWKKDWKHGHYVVVIGYDLDKFYFEDPWCSERTYLKFDELKDRWHDVDIDGKKYIECGIVVRGKKKTYDSKRVVHMK